MAEAKLTTMANLGEIKSIDFVNKFSKNINDLLTLLGVTRRQELTSDLKIQTYKWTADVNATNPAEGEDIPLSQWYAQKRKHTRSLGSRNVVPCQRKQSRVTVRQ